MMIPSGATPPQSIAETRPVSGSNVVREDRGESASAAGGQMIARARASHAIATPCLYHFVGRGSIVIRRPLESPDLCERGEATFHQNITHAMTPRTINHFMVSSF